MGATKYLLLRGAPMIDLVKSKRKRKRRQFLNKIGWLHSLERQWLCFCSFISPIDHDDVENCNLSTVNPLRMPTKMFLSIEEKVLATLLFLLKKANLFKILFYFLLFFNSQLLLITIGIHLHQQVLLKLCMRQISRTLSLIQEQLMQTRGNKVPTWVGLKLFVECPILFLYMVSRVTK